MLPSLLVSVLAVILGLTQPREVTISITVTTEGIGVAEIPITVRDGYKDSYGATDAAGKLAIRKQVSPRQKWLAVLPLPELLRAGESPEQWAERHAKDDAKLERHAYRGFYRIDLVPDKQDYTLSIDVKPARTLRCRAMRGAKPLQFGTVSAGHWSRSGDVKTDGRVELTGMPREAFDLFINTGLEATRVSVPAGDKDIELGEVQVVSRERSSPVNMTITNLRHLSKTLIWIDEGVTLVSSDAKHIISLGTDRLASDSTKDSTTCDPPQEIPPGTWYVAPLCFVDSPTQLRLIERVAKGQTPPGVPVIKAVAGQPVALEFDAKEVERAILTP